MNDFSDLTYTFTHEELQEHDSEVRKDIVNKILEKIYSLSKEEELEVEKI